MVNSLVLFFERFKLNISFLQNKFCSAMGNKMYPKKKNIRRMGVRKGEEKRRKRMTILENSWEPIFIDVVNKSSGYYGVIKIVS